MHHHFGLYYHINFALLCPEVCNTDNGWLLMSVLPSFKSPFRLIWTAWMSVRYTGKPRAEQRLHWFWAAHLEEGNPYSNTVNEKKLQGGEFCHPTWTWWFCCRMRGVPSSALILHDTSITCLLLPGKRWYSPNPTAQKSKLSSRVPGAKLNTSKTKKK